MDRFEKMILENRVRDDSYTHTIFGRVKGKMKIEEEELKNIKVYMMQHEPPKPPKPP